MSQWLDKLLGPDEPDDDLVAEYRRLLRSIPLDGTATEEQWNRLQELFEMVRMRESL